MGYCHRLVRDVAKGIAGAFYEVSASDNKFYAQHPSQPRFIRAHWQNFVDPARENLAKLLQMSSVTDHQKAAIYNALLLDHSAPRGGKHLVLDEETIMAGRT